MVKICHVTCVHQPEDGRIFRRACVSTALAGYETYLVQKGRSYDKNGVHIIGIGTPKKDGRLYRMFEFAKLAYNTAVIVDADIYQLHDPELLQFAVKLKRRGKKVIFDSHENYSDIILKKNYLPFHKIVGKVAYSYINRVLAKVDGITYPSDDDYYRKLKIICRNTCITGNYPWKHELYDRYKDKALTEHNSACFIGSLTSVYGITEIVKACYRAGFKLYLAGPFYSEEYKQNLFAMQEFACVNYLGIIDREKVYEVLQMVEVGLCVLHNTGQFYTARTLPTKVYEYMAMGLPVILNNSPYNVEIANRLQFGVCVDPLKIDDITNALQGLSNNDDLRRRFGKNGRNAVLKYFCWDQEQQNLLKMYESILKCN